MIDFGLKKLSFPEWKNQNILNDETLKNLYGKNAIQYFNKNISTPFVFSDSKSFDLMNLSNFFKQ